MQGVYARAKEFISKVHKTLILEEIQYALETLEAATGEAPVISPVPHGMSQKTLGVNPNERVPSRGAIRRPCKEPDDDSMESILSTRDHLDPLINYAMSFEGA